MAERDPKVHEVCNFGEYVVTRRVYPTAPVYVSAGVIREFATDYLTEIWRRIPMFVRITINGSVEWSGISDLHSTDEPAWTDNILDHRHS